MGVAQAAFPGNQEMRKIVVAFAVALSLAIAADAAAQAKRPRVGLVLGGGGARGMAHVGFLEVLEELRVPVDCVAGTSMGALVAGTYVAGSSPAEMTRLISETDWESIFDDGPKREKLDLRRKEIEDRSFPALEFGIKRNGVQFRDGAVGGEKIKLFINQLVGNSRGERVIQKLPLPLTLIATDIGTGKKFAMREGSLATAMRASMSVPGVLEPVTIGDHKLVDGGLVDNVPIDEVRQSCADVVIAVDVGSPLLSKDDVNGPINVAIQMVNLLTQQNVDRSLASLRPGDILVSPDLGTISAADFARWKEGMARGRAAGEAARERLAKFSVSPAEYRLWRARIRDAPAAPRIVDEIRIAAMQRVNPELVQSYLKIKVGEPLDLKKLNESLVDVLGEGDFDSVDYNIEIDDRDRYVVQIVAKEKSIGPNYLMFGVNMSSNFADNASYNLRAAVDMTWMNSLGADWLTVLQIGERGGIATQWHQPLDGRQKTFFTVGASYQDQILPLYFNGDRIADYDVKQVRAYGVAGFKLAPWSQVQAGYQQRGIRSKVIVGQILFENAKQNVGGPIAEFRYDTRNEPILPTEGAYVDLSWYGVNTGLSEGLKPYAAFDGVAIVAREWDRFAGSALYRYARSTRGTLPAYDALMMGGPLNLTGFALNQFLGDDIQYARMTAQWQLMKSSSFLKTRVDAGLLLEAGRMGVRYTEPALGGWQPSYGAYVATTSAIGPLYLGGAKAPNGGPFRWFLFLGTP
jgi:NTE family protein